MRSRGIVLLLLVLAGPARADVIHLNTGGIVKGEIISENEEGFRVKTSTGVIITVLHEDVARIDKGVTPETLYREGLKKLAPDDADGHYRLGVDLRKARRDAEARDCFERALKIDPNHVLAGIALQQYDDEAHKEALVPATSEPAVSEPSASTGVLGPETKKVLEAAERGARSADPAARKAAWEKLAALYAGLPTNEEKDAVRGRASALEAALRGTYEKNARRLAQAIPAYASGDMRKLRDSCLGRWEAAAKAALDVIFDVKIYPDENHGKAGQKFVDEKVKGKDGRGGVEAVWPAFDQLVTNDVARFRDMTEEQARAFSDALDRCMALLIEAHDGLAALEVAGQKALPEPPPRIHRALLLYRAGRVDDAYAIAREGAPEGKDWAISPWEVRLLERLRDLRVLAYNDLMLAQRVSPEKGKRPNGEEAKQVAVTNLYRMKLGRAALEIHPCLVDAARGHSQEMSQLGYFAHESPVEKNKTPCDRARNAGYEKPVAENIAEGAASPQGAHDMWYNSAPHHRNILGEAHLSLGAGLDGRHWTQDFGDEGMLAR